jgi:acetyl esterase/lipase
VASLVETLGARALRLVPERWIERMLGAPLEIRGRRLAPRLQLLAKLSAGRTPFHRMTPAEARATSREALALADSAPCPMDRIEHRVVPGPAGSIPVRVYHPPDLAGARPLLLYFHQGGCVIGDLDGCETFCTLLAATARCPVMSVDYRLGPEHRFPAAQEDAFAAYRWAAEHAGEVGGDPTRLAVGGDSAGGGLAAAITHEMKRSRGPQPLVQLLIYPWLLAYADNAAYRDFAEAFPLTPEGMRWFLAHYLSDEADRDDPRLSPLLEKDFVGLAPAIVVTAGFDPLCDEGDEYAHRLADAGVPVRHRCYESLCHSFTSLSGAAPAARAALEEIARDLDRALSGGPL